MMPPQALRPAGAHGRPGPCAGLAPARLLISAAHKSSGKTTISVGLCAEMRRRGLRVAPFKKGPDYIDPMWLARAGGHPCFNLDPHLMAPGALPAWFARRAAGADVALVEGNKGLYDGLALDGSNSNAALAALLALPVLLVLDARGMTRGVAPLILGYQAFDRNIRIAGVILNRLGGSRHEAKLRAVIEHYTDARVVGAVHESDAVALAERHLGLMPDRETDEADALVERIREAVAAQVDVGEVLDCARTAGSGPAGPTVGAGESPVAPPRCDAVRIGIAMDRAFGFYYPDDLEAMRRAGAQLVPFDTLRDARLPPVDGLFFGGGFPETSARALEANISLRAAIRGAVDAGMPVYAECGGLMYLAREIRGDDGQVCAMVGALPATVRMHRKPVGRGYVELEATGAAPFDVAGAPGGRILGHEFHYSSLEGLPEDTRFAFRVLRGHGIDGRHDGIVHRRTLASYSHLRTAAGSDWAPSFVEHVRRARAGTGPAPAAAEPAESAA